MNRNKLQWLSSLSMVMNFKVSSGSTQRKWSRMTALSNNKMPLKRRSLNWLRKGWQRGSKKRSLRTHKMLRKLTILSPNIKGLLTRKAPNRLSIERQRKCFRSKMRS